MFLPENIDLAFPEKYILSIRCAPNGFSFSIHSPTDSGIFHYKSAPLGSNTPMVEQIKKLVFDAGFFSYTFQKTCVIIASEEFTLVPDSLFDKSEADGLRRFNISEDATMQRTLFSSIDELPIHIVYGVEEELHSFLIRHMWNPQFVHRSELVISAFLNHNRTIEGHRCYVDFHDDKVSLVAFDGNDLLVATDFDNKNRYDAAYFIAGVWEKLHFDQTNDFLFVSGNAAQYEETHNVLKKLIRKTIVISMSPKTIISDSEKAIIPTDMLTQL